jgi:hypothetical protein
MGKSEEAYFPKDGVSFLLAVWATYCRGSRLWAVASRDGEPPEE